MNPASQKTLKLLWEVWQYSLPLDTGNLKLGQTKCPVFLQNFQIPCVFPDRDIFWPFSLFSLCLGDPACITVVKIRLKKKSVISLFVLKIGIYHRVGQKVFK